MTSEAEWDPSVLDNNIATVITGHFDGLGSRGASCPLTREVCDGVTISGRWKDEPIFPPILFKITSKADDERSWDWNKADDRSTKAFHGVMDQIATKLTKVKDFQ
jgi:hypothetical protein